MKRFIAIALVAALLSLNISSASLVDDFAAFFSSFNPTGMAVGECAGYCYSDGWCAETQTCEYDLDWDEYYCSENPSCGATAASQETPTPSPAPTSSPSVPSCWTCDASLYSSWISDTACDSRCGESSSASSQCYSSACSSSSPPATSSCDPSTCAGSNWCYNGQCSPCSPGYYNCDASGGCESATPCGSIAPTPLPPSSSCSYSASPDGCSAGQYCYSGACSSCSSGYANCDRTASCEKNLNTDPDNCGSCGSVCASRICSAGVCAVQTQSSDSCSSYVSCLSCVNVNPCGWAKNLNKCKSGSYTGSTDATSSGTGWAWSSSDCSASSSPTPAPSPTPSPVIDTTPPSVLVSSTPSGSSAVTLTATASDASGIGSIVIYANEGSGYAAKQTCYSSACSAYMGPYSTAKTVSYYVLASDSANNQKYSSAESFTVSSPAPSPATSPAPTPTSSPTPSPTPSQPTADPCSSYSSCPSCVNVNPCGWAKSLSKCKTGTIDRANDGSASAMDNSWAWSSDECPVVQSTPSPTPAPTPSPTPVQQSSTTTTIKITTAITVTGTAKPDLIIESVSFSKIDGILYASVKIKNAGKADINRGAYSGGSLINELVVSVENRNVFVGSLEADQSVEVLVPAYDFTEGKQVTAIIDSNNVIGESDETNNEFKATVKTTPTESAASGKSDKPAPLIENIKSEIFSSNIMVTVNAKGPPIETLELYTNHGAYLYGCGRQAMCSGRLVIPKSGDKELKFVAVAYDIYGVQSSGIRGHWKGGDEINFMDEKITVVSVISEGAVIKRGNKQINANKNVLTEFDGVVIFVTDVYDKDNEKHARMYLGKDKITVVNYCLASSQFDLNSDGKTDDNDADVCKPHMDKEAGEESKKCDFNGDCLVDLRDLAVLGSKMSEKDAEKKTDKSASASSNSGMAGRAVDGDTADKNKFWEPENEEGKKGDWWQVDLGSVHKISLVKVYSFAGNFHDWYSKFHIEVSETGKFEGEQKTIAAETDWDKSRAEKQFVGYSFNTVEARYVRIVSDVDQKYVKLQEVRVYEKLNKESKCDLPYETGVDFGSGCRSGTACYYQCGGVDGYRSSEESIMGFSKISEFNAVSREHMQNVMDCVYPAGTYYDSEKCSEWNRKNNDAWTESISRFVESAPQESAETEKDCTKVTDGMRITSSAKLCKGEYRFAKKGTSGVIVIDADNVVLDCNGASIIGLNNDGVGIYNNGHNGVEIRDCRISNFFYGVYSASGDKIRIINNDISENKIVLGTGWIHIRQGPDNPYGGGVYLRKSDGSLIENNILKNQQDGIDLFEVTNTVVRKNIASHNFGWGVQLYASSNNEVSDNDFSYTNRFCDSGQKAKQCKLGGFESSIYGCGCDSAAMLVIARSNNNKILRNNLRYSGDGFFLAGGADIGPSEGNTVIGNDGSFSPHNAFESTFSGRNTFAENTATGSDHGFWLGYSYDNVVQNNIIANNENERGTSSGISIENGRNNRIEDNAIYENNVGVKIWLPEKTIKGYERSSKGYKIIGNEIKENNVGIIIEKTTDSDISGNKFIGNDKEIQEKETTGVSKNNNAITKGENE